MGKYPLPTRANFVFGCYPIPTYPTHFALGYTTLNTSPQKNKWLDVGHTEGQPSFDHEENGRTVAIAPGGKPYGHYYDHISLDRARQI